jgi:beta-carotene ketolase (CrtW type)
LSGGPSGAGLGSRPRVPSVPQGDGAWGLGLSSLLLVGWTLSLLLLLLPADPATMGAGSILLAVAVRTFLQTGLFIVAHDAMHRSLVPGRHRLNDRLGRLALVLYACLPYGPCRRKHLRHHRSPGSHRDPDFHAPEAQGVAAWYARFMGGYLGPAQMAALLGSWGLTALTLPVAGGNPLSVLLFWTLPLLLSSLQLFLIGTYLPHRGGGGAGNRHHAHTLPLPEALSLLACYHFGYHWEHHEFPELPWFRLPGRHRLLKECIPCSAALASTAPAR